MFMGGPSHQIPMFMLHQKYLKRIKGLKNHFLLPNHVHDTFKEGGVNVLPINYKLNINEPSSINKNILSSFLELEKEAFSLSRPDIILEDCSFSSPLHAEKNGIPRISIHRTGFFRSIANNKRNPNHKHSLESKGGLSLFNTCNKKPSKKVKEKTPQELILDYLHGRTKIIPGIPSIEKLPDDIVDKESYFYSGPLNLDDNLSDLALLRKINDFIFLNKSRKKVFITTGLVDKQDISKIINFLLKEGWAVISSVKHEPEMTHKSQFFYDSFFPLNFVCSKVDLVVHHCGSGMYHYPLLNEKPVITLGTQSFDREDVALRLEELDLSKHVPSSKDDDAFLDIFESHINDFKKDKLCDYTALSNIKKEIDFTMESFDPHKIINFTINKN